MIVVVGGSEVGGSDGSGSDGSEVGGSGGGSDEVGESDVDVGDIGDAVGAAMARCVGKLPKNKLITQRARSSLFIRKV